MAAAKELMGSSLLGTTTSCLLPSKTKWSPVLGSFLTPVVVVVIHDNKRKNKRSHVGIHASATEKVVPKVADDVPAKVKVRAAVTVRWNKRTNLMEKIANHVDAVADMVGRNVVMELISTDVDPVTRRPKRSGEAVMKGWLEKMREVKKQRVVYSVEFTVDSSFGTAGAVTVTNWHRREFFVETIVVEGFPAGLVRFNCYSWVQLSKDCQDKRVFFADKYFSVVQPYLPLETPEGLRELREKELEAARGDGKGERRASDRIYDYATYNDLGNPDKGGDYKRPTLGGEDIPYPRRLRTGRPSTFSGVITLTSINL